MDSIVIDIFTRKLWARPTKTKTAGDVLMALMDILKDAGLPKRLDSDNGNEFKGVVAQYLKDNGVIQRMNEIGDHSVLGVVDRVSRTIKSIIYKHFTYSDNTVDAYNKTFLKVTPNHADKYEVDTRRVWYEKIKADL